MIITGKKFSKPKLSRVINGDDVLPEAPQHEPKKRLDHLLVEQHLEFCRSSLQKFIKNGNVTVNGEVVTKPNTQIPLDAKIELNVPEQPEIPPRPPVIYEDDYVLVLDKPAGLLSESKGQWCPEPTLENYGLLVHRLDRDTSGVIILAKDHETQTMLRRQFQQRSTHKTYFAITDGHPKLDKALIDLPLARRLGQPNTFTVDPGGRASQTTYEVIEKTPHYSLFELHPASGRTHQLRVHLSHIGNPIVGDRIYNPDSRAPRLMLHAARLEITIPGANGPDRSDQKHPNQRKIFESPVPHIFAEFLAADMLENSDATASSSAPGSSETPEPPSAPESPHVPRES